MEILIWIVFWAIVGGVVTPFVYRSKGRDPVKGLLAGACAGAIGGIFVLAPVWLTLSRPSKNCPKCGQTVFQDALVCKYCGYQFLDRQAAVPAPQMAHRADAAASALPIAIMPPPLPHDPQARNYVVTNGVRVGLQEAGRLSQTGQRDGALALLHEITQLAPDNKIAWWGIASVSPDGWVKRQAAQRVLALDPAFEKARKLLEHLGPETEHDPFEGVYVAPTITPPAAPRVRQEAIPAPRRFTLTRMVLLYLLPLEVLGVAGFVICLFFMLFEIWPDNNAFGIFTGGIVFVALVGGTLALWQWIPRLSYRWLPPFFYAGLILLAMLIPLFLYWLHYTADVRIYAHSERGQYDVTYVPMLFDLPLLAVVAGWPVVGLRGGIAFLRRWLPGRTMPFAVALFLGGLLWFPALAMAEGPYMRLIAANVTPMKLCWACREWVREDALVCPHCKAQHPAHQPG